MKTVCFTKPSLPYNAGDVVTLSDEMGESALRHPMGIVREATQRDVDDVYRRLGKEPPEHTVGVVMVSTSQVAESMAGEVVEPPPGGSPSSRKR